MTITSQGRKISNFPALATIPDGAVLTFVSGSTNYKITKANFLTALGVTGTLVADGSAGAIPVLQTSGSTYTIRGLEDGAGIVCSVSPDNGITIANAFIQQGTYTALVDDFTDATPTFASIKGGTGISVAKASDVITISASGDLPFGIVTMQANATATTILGTATAALTAGTWAVGASDDFTGSTGGRLTYTGADTIRVFIDASVTFRRAVGSGEIDVSVALARNGSVNAASKRVTSCTNSASGAVSVPYTIELAQNDYLELYVANEETAQNITVTDAIFRAAR